MRTGLSTRPAPGPSDWKSFLMSGLATLDAMRMTTGSTTTRKRSKGSRTLVPNRKALGPTGGDKAHRGFGAY
ncbi:hypothetical protein GCM10009612_71560 [Streptomyces beijiangensis]